MTEPRFVTVAEAGRRLQLRNVSDYRAKYPGFPEPADDVAGAAVYEWEAVRAWYVASVHAPRTRPTTHEGDT